MSLDENESMHLALEVLHKASGARFTNFAGYAMPLHYEHGVLAENLHTRNKVSLFDVSHMGQLCVYPKDEDPKTLYQQLEAVFPVDFDGWELGVQKYSYLLNESGGILDDLMIAHVQEDKRVYARIVVNASNRALCFDMLCRLCPDLVVEWIDSVLLAIQGPMAEAVLCAVDASCADLFFMQGKKISGLDNAWVFRSGYTGEDGYELSASAEEGQQLAEQFLSFSELRWAGLGARDTLRIEAGLPLHGNDISSVVTPVEAGLGFAIPETRRLGGKKEAGFPGAEVILKQLQYGTPYKFVGLISSEGIPIRPPAPILSGERVIGIVTSGTVSPGLGRPVMLARLESDSLEGDLDLCALVRQHRPKVKLVCLPFLPKRYRYRC